MSTIKLLGIWNKLDLLRTVIHEGKHRNQKTVTKSMALFKLSNLFFTLPREEHWNALPSFT